ncbi:MAG: hypothetical protein RMI91_09890 [Gemmatales bacterium]|nr:hypothetical protein [Gemmatales bacterium]MDW7994951.1 hypothetical protein [Gemmatales bacterium]
MAHREDNLFYRARLWAAEPRPISPLKPVRQWLVRLDQSRSLKLDVALHSLNPQLASALNHCKQAWSAGMNVFPTFPLLIRKCLGDVSGQDTDHEQRQPIERLLHLFQLFTPLEEREGSSPRLTFASREVPTECAERCFDFLASFGSLLRTWAYGYCVTATDQPAYCGVFPPTRRVKPPNTVWRKLLSQYQSTLAWAMQTYLRWGPTLVYAALSARSSWDWLRRAQEIEPETELADPRYADHQEVNRLTQRVQDLWTEFDEFDLVGALGTKLLLLQTDKTANRLPTYPEQDCLIEPLAELLEQWQERLTQAHEWLQEHGETFFLISAQLQSVAAGFRSDLDNDCELFLTAGKYVTMLDALEVAEGVSPPASLSHKAPSLEQKERHVLSQDNLELPEDAFARSEVDWPDLAAASAVEAPPKTLIWEAPDKRYKAYLLIVRNHAVIRFLTSSTGAEASILEGTPIILAGVKAQIGEHACAIIPLRELLDSTHDLYLEVGRDRLRWRPVRHAQPN